MLVRVIGAVAMLGIAVPAMAEEHPGYTAAPDALRLLLQDDIATSGTLSPFVAHSDPLPDTLTRFEALMVPGTTLALNVDVIAIDTQPLDRRRLTEGTVLFDARSAIADVMADYPRPFRRRDILDTMVTFRLDGQQRTRTLSVGGVAGAVWDMMPRR